ncbi:MAG: hypothetical protein WD045_05075 [Pirellulaceae bacterium]
MSVATLAKSVGELRTRFTPGFNQTRGTPTVFATVATRELDTTTPPPHHHACVSVATLAKSVEEVLTRLGGTVDGRQIPCANGILPVP